MADLLSLYGVTDEAEREKLLALARTASAPDWWQQYSDILPRWLELYIGLEKAASVIRTYEVQFVHGLMQTEDYARAVILISNAHASAEEIERRVSLRMQRQELLVQPDAPELWAVLDEAALRRSPDGHRPGIAHRLRRQRPLQVGLCTRARQVSPAGPPRKARTRLPSAATGSAVAARRSLRPPAAGRSGWP